MRIKLQLDKRSNFRCFSVSRVFVDNDNELYIFKKLEERILNDFIIKKQCMF